MAQYTAAVITVSSKGYRGEREETSGPALCRLLEADGWEVVRRALVPDDMAEIRSELLRCSDELHISLVLTTGGTGFSPQDITPEATRAVLARETPGIPEAMRAESMCLTPRGCLSRGVAGIRGRSLIVNLPGSERAALENLLAVRKAIRHGVDMLRSPGADGDAAADGAERRAAPSTSQWLREARADADAARCGIYLFHNGVVRRTAADAQARQADGDRPVSGMRVSFDAARVEEAVRRARGMDGVHYVRVWINEGELAVGDDILLVLVGGDIRSRTADALSALTEELRSCCIVEQELC